MASAKWPTCPSCGSPAVEILHEANPEAPSTHATLKCTECEHVFKDVIRSPDVLEVSAVISEGAESEHTTLELPADQRLQVGDELQAKGHRLQVTGLERGEGKRIRSATARELETIWCKVFDTVDLAFAVNTGKLTWNGELTVPPEENFLVGDEVTVRGEVVIVHAIKTKMGIRRRGGARAKEIVRVYAHPKAEHADWSGNRPHYGGDEEP